MMQIVDVVLMLGSVDMLCVEVDLVLCLHLSKSAFANFIDFY